MQVEPGTEIHSVPKPIEEFHCPPDPDEQTTFRLNSKAKKCYIFAKNSIYGGNLWKTPDFADEYCRNYSSQVVTIHSEQEQEFVTSHILGNRIYQMLFLGIFSINYENEFHEELTFLPPFD